jgi:hypothetical protein
MRGYLNVGPLTCVASANKSPLAIYDAKCPPRKDFSATGWAHLLWGLWGAVEQPGLEPATNGL